jgi:very-short-patch-repair endonuclease
VRQWLTVLERTRPLFTLAADFLGATQGMAPGAFSVLLAEKTRYELDLVLLAWEPSLPPGEASTACMLLLRLAQAIHRSGGAPDALLTAWGVEPLRVLAAVHALVPEGLAPALLVSGPAAPPWLAEAARLAAQVCDAVPSLPVALQATPSEVDAYLRDGESQARALVREGRVSLEAPSAREVGLRLESLGFPADRAPSGLLERLAEDGVPDEVLARYGEAARELEAAAHSPEAMDRARSSAERFLYALLEALPDTRGLFELNARAEFHLRGRAVEVDFLSRRLRVAIEVDGYHHFRDEARYRRDRRKDLALQCHDYWVVRFLAQDVVARLEEIRDTLREVVSLRREGPGGSPSHREDGDAGA